MERYVCIHGHFYQPPRENPWLEAIEVQDSAYPYHDWNERITAECYEPNATSRILDGDRRIVEIVNNYSRISFNFGPTLLAWMERSAPSVYAAIQRADQQSQQRFSGHGSAIAQAYNHMIMPLANRRDKITQVVWGIRDFKHRFGRKPEGMWLAETAVDLETLEILAKHGIRFTILSPYQAGRVKVHGGRKWHDAKGANVDPKTPYEQRLPSGRSIAIFFYDGPISQGIAFERLLARGEDLAHRLVGAFAHHDARPQLVHIATDGESYGHHHAHGDMALAYALYYIEHNNLARLTNYGEYLQLHGRRLPQVEIVENTAWSCSHGIGRWQDDCGCNSGRAGWHQKWRRPLRDALDWLRDAVAPHFERVAGKWFSDPWAARDDYISLVLDRSPENVRRFFKRTAATALQPGEMIVPLQLLELQRHAMLMYTSCGWFFDELSGIETVQIIQYAARVIQLAERLFGVQFEAEFLARLEQAKSNLPEHQDGRLIYEKWCKRAAVDLTKVAAHYAASSLFENYPEQTRVYCYTVDRRDYEKLEAGPAKLAIGRCQISSTITHDAALLSFACMHLGDHNLVGGVRTFAGDESYSEMEHALREAFGKVDFPEMIRLLDHHFAGAPFALTTLFREEQRKILKIILHSSLERSEDAYRSQYEQQMILMTFLGELGIAIPRAFRMTAELVLDADLRRALANPQIDVPQVRNLLHQARIWQVQLDAAGLGYLLERTIESLATALDQQTDNEDRLDQLFAAVEVAGLMPFDVGSFKAQNIVYDLVRRVGSRPKSDDLPHTEKLKQLGEKLCIRVDNPTVAGTV